MTKENYEQYLTQCLETDVLNLEWRCENLAKDLTRAAKHANEKGIDIDVGSTGLIQNQGLQIDLLCMKIHMLQRELALYKAERIK